MKLSAWYNTLWLMILERYLHYICYYSETVGSGSLGSRIWIRPWRFLFALHRSIAVAPSEFLMEAFTPALTSAVTAATLPTEHANMSAVHPSSSTAFRSTFFSIKKSRTPAWLCTAADMAAVPPSADCRSRRLGPRFIALSTSVEPIDAASIAAVLPEFSPLAWMSASAPASMSSTTFSTSPAYAAACSFVRPVKVSWSSTPICPDVVVCVRERERGGRE
mmetsp:Transcript_37985/g.94201  ORF Transcript_37985/g.94201 Transcript_37985/m.94201 type:complete len:220 (+) Transcript_37985:177-836(+)